MGGAWSRWRADLKMAGAPGSDGVFLCPMRLAQAEAVVGDWMLEFTCYCLCRHFREGRTAEFRRCRNVAQAVINSLSKIPARQKKTVYLCQLLTRIAKGKRLDCHFENDQRISPLESALSVWTLLEREEGKPDKLHEDIRRLIQIQVVAVHMEKGYFKEAAEVLERLFTDLESNKPLRMKLATIVKSKDPYVPFLQNFSYDLLISKMKSYVELFIKDNETNFLIQAATKEVEAKELGATMLQKETVNVSETEEESNLETNQSSMEEQSITNQSSGDVRKPIVRHRSGQKHRKKSVLQSLNSLQNVEKHGDAWACGRKRQMAFHCNGSVPVFSPFVAVFSVSYIQTVCSASKRKCTLFSHS
ncbi:telomeric repeat-binding factor 1 isoform X3 [Dromaius novaehollandiae]|uniref:telomeric repeat-binding factor 1 isoform X3 n=1 Tax=Dromaius novaehollandiae TaxID=8790 RepID=UPI00311F33DB